MLKHFFKELVLRNKNVKQFSGLYRVGRSNNKKSLEGNYSNITSKEPAIGP